MSGHLFEAMEREIDFQIEFDKLEKMVVVEDWNYRTLNDWLEEHFREWKYRDNYTELNELRKQLGFKIYKYGSEYYFEKRIDINKYFLYCEMLINLFFGLTKNRIPFIQKQIDDITQTIKTVIEKTGFELAQIEDRYIIVEKDAISIEVADKAPELADVIIEYNHYLLKGDINKKRMILKTIADSLEPKRKALGQICKSNTEDFFDLVNTMNIRHNNLDPSAQKLYNPKFASLPTDQQEEWYDLIYEQALGLYVTLEQQERNKKIKAYKA